MSRALQALARIVTHLPLSWLRYPGALLGWISGTVLGIRRAHVVASMQRAEIVDARATARTMYASLGTGILELLWLAGSRIRASSRVRLTDRAQALVDRYRSAPRGLVVLTAHTGNWDWVACAAAEMLDGLAVVTKRLRVGWLDRFWQATRSARGIQLVGVEGALSAARHVLARGGAIAMMIDQAPERASSVCVAEFLGSPAVCDLAPMLVAMRAHATVALALSHRDSSGVHVIDVPIVLEPPPRASRRWAESACVEMQRALERWVREHPSQWLWMHRRWKGARDAAQRTELAADPCRESGRRVHEAA